MIKKIFVALLLLAGLSANVAFADGTGGFSGAACIGRLFNPMSDTDWNNLYPITIAGVQTGPGVNPPLMYEPPVCVCPGIFGIPSPGIGITFWEPLYVAEIERTAGCLESLGGESIFGASSGATSGFAALNSEQSNRNGLVEANVSRMQIHWYEYPVFGVLDMFQSLACMSAPTFDLAYLTEVDYTWQDDEWGIFFSPEAALFADPVLQAACSLEAVSSTMGFPLDAMIWCSGSWGGTYPLTGNGNQSNSPFTLNNLVMSKFIARQSRLGLQWQTIGPNAICSAMPNPVWVKSQYRIDQVGPVPRYGKPVVIGDEALTQTPQVSNAPTHESTVNLIWQGEQCCVRFW